MNKTVTVIKPDIARKLLHENFKIVDLKPKFNIDGSGIDYTRAVFLFEFKEGIYELIRQFQ